MEEDREKPDKKPLDIDRGKLLPAGVNDGDSPEVVIDQSATTAPKAAEPPKPSSMSADQPSGFGDGGEMLLITDHQLEEKIRRVKKNIETGFTKLIDGGVKLKTFLRRLEEERERRRLDKLDKVTDESKKPLQSQNSIVFGPPNGSRQEDRSPTVHPQSSFGIELSKRIDENSSSRRVDKEFGDFDCHDRGRKRSNGHVSPKARQKCRSSPRQRAVLFSRSASLNGNRHGCSTDDLNGRSSSSYSLHHLRENSLNICANKRNALQVPLADDPIASEDQAVVLVDEEDCQTTETNEYEEKLTKCMKETKIDYPSRDDPDPVIISYADMECLAPEAYLTSTIMNFYIRYLEQATLSNRMVCDYLIFNTYFYEKLKEAVTYKGSGKNTKFVKFRRWWKGVNIFQKAYVLIPIHQDLHWSLVIICIPDKNDESGPIILHLDSLELHSSRSVFDNIKRYLKEEWNFLNQEVGDIEPAIADNIWKHLPRRIEEKKITVPQQRNDYDCGLFVLFFMERFIADAPKRLMKRKDLPSMFGKEWFKPEEASGLRRKIRNLLKEEFQNVSRSSRNVMNTCPESENGNAELVTDIK